MLKRNLRDLPALAHRLADYVVLAHDPAVPEVAPDYWKLSEPQYRLVAAAVRALARGNPVTQARLRELSDSPLEPGRHRKFRHCLLPGLADPHTRSELTRIVTDADARIWIDLHLGARYNATAPAVPARQLERMALNVWPSSGRPGRADVQVVIPFRGSAGGLRSRNLLACLLALRDQDFEPGRRWITVVESDAQARWANIIEPLADQYLFVPSSRAFNKSWAVNVGVVHCAAERPPLIICILDADMIVDRYFLSRNVRRLLGGPHGGHLPFRWSLSLDGAASQTAIRRRIWDGTPHVPLRELRGQLLRDPPGGSLWLYPEVFHRVRGFDERYEGWGGEDGDFLARLSRITTINRFTDTMLHLHHERPQVPRDRPTANAEIAPLSWHPVTGYGDLRHPSGRAPEKVPTAGRG